MASTMVNVVLQMVLEVAVVFKDVSTPLTPGMTTGCSAVLQQRLFGFEGVLAQRASEDSAAAVDNDAGSHVRHFPLLSS